MQTFSLDGNFARMRLDGRRRGTQFGEQFYKEVLITANNKTFVKRS